MGNYNILFCDDEDSILEFYQKFVSENEYLKEITNESYFSMSLNNDIVNIISVKNICADLNKHNKVLDIAILDINFNNIKPFEEIDDNSYSFEDLGVYICKYIIGYFPTSEIIFVSGNPSHVKKHYELYSSNIHFIEKKGNLKKELEEKIFEIIDKKQPKEKVISNSKYLYNIDFIKGNSINLLLENPKVKKGNKSLQIEFKLTKKPFKVLSALILNCCYDQKNNKIENKPKSIYSHTLEKALMEKEELNVRLIENNKHFLKDLFKKISNTQAPFCNFDLDKAKNLEFGFKSDLRKRDSYNNNCKLTCELFLENYHICPVNLSMIEDINKKVLVTKDITSLRGEVKKQITLSLKGLKDINDYKWVDGKDISLECYCNTNNEQIMTCSNPFCSYSIIFSEKFISGAATTQYQFLAKPTDRLIKEIYDFLEE